MVCFFVFFKIASLNERFENVDLNDADQVWSLLTDAERQEFESLVRNGEAEKLVPHWTPWWIDSNSQLVQELQDSTKDYLTRCPQIIDVPLIKDISVSFIIVI